MVSAGAILIRASMRVWFWVPSTGAGSGRAHICMLRLWNVVFAKPPPPEPPLNEEAAKEAAKEARSFEFLCGLRGNVGSPKGSRRATTAN